MAKFVTIGERLSTTAPAVNKAFTERDPEPIIKRVGLLKAFGMRNATLREVFLWRAAFVTLRGLAWGNAAGLAVCLVQKYFHVVKLSSEGYLLSEVPVALGWGWWLALNAGVVAAIVALLVVPACIVSTVKPDESIRYE